LAKGIDFIGCSPFSFWKAIDKFEYRRGYSSRPMRRGGSGKPSRLDRRPGAHHPHPGAQDRDQIVRTSRQMLHEIGREPTPEELAEKLGMPLEKVRKVLKIAKERISLETHELATERSSAARFPRSRLNW
jgi:RNA polymerase primary sigma factor